MKHVGDITKLNGALLPKVDCIVGGSPCQDLSVAGAMKGLAGERSGLLLEQIRLINEMREDDRRSGAAGACVRPRYAVWERCNGKGTAIWASEIEELCIAVTKKHFSEEEE